MSPETILVVAPIGQDAKLLVAALADAGLDATELRDVQALARSIGDASPHGPGAALVAEEALDPVRIAPLVARLGDQPPWSDLPILVLTGGGTLSRERLKALDAFGPAGSVTLLERPFRAHTLTALVQVALRSRRRQYEVRDHLLRQHEIAQALARKAAELERSNADLEQFAAIASHDLQEPLRMITSYIQILQHRYEQVIDDNGRRYMQFVSDGSRRMTAMIKGILEYSRIGQALPSFGACDSMAALGDALNDLEGKLREKGARVMADQLPIVRSDRVALCQVFQNLISNAVKFCESAPSIKVQASETPDEWVFSVADNGVGIPREAQDRIFKIFQRLHTDEKYRGTGIGLATCKKIVDLHGGRIWVESTIGVGSIFFFALPK